MMPDSAYYNRNILLEKAIPFSKHLANELLMEIAAVNKIFNKFIEISLTSPSQIWCDCQLRFPNSVPQMSPIRRRQLRRSASCLAAAILVAPAALFSNTATAATIYWDGTGTSWNLTASWSTNSGATTPDPAAVPGSGDDAVFNISTVNTNQTISLNSDQSANSLLFRSAGTVLIQGGN